MAFDLTLTETASAQLEQLERQDQKKLKKVRKCLAFLQANPKHPGLETHEYRSLEGTGGEKVWEAYVENRTPAAWRVFWHYGPGKNEITVLAITPHP